MYVCWVPGKVALVVVVANGDGLRTMKDEVDNYTW